MEEYIKREALIENLNRFAPEHYNALVNMLIKKQPAADVVEVEKVVEMLDYMLGNCPCNYSPTDEWLPEKCELQEECPNPKEKFGCWKQFIKYYGERKE